MTADAVGVVAYLLPLAEWVEERIMQFKLGSAIKWLSGGMVVLAIVLCVHNKGAIIRDADILDDLKTANTLLKMKLLSVPIVVRMANGASVFTFCAARQKTA